MSNKEIYKHININIISVISTSDMVGIDNFYPMVHISDKIRLQHIQENEDIDDWVFINISMNIIYVISTYSYAKQTENTEGSIKNGQSRETGNIGYTINFILWNISSTKPGLQRTQAMCKPNIKLFKKNEGMFNIDSHYQTI